MQPRRGLRHTAFEAGWSRIIPRMEPVQPGTDDPLAAGWRALAEANWRAAADAFASIAEREPTPEAFEGLAEAWWWQHQEAPTFDARERAYHLYRRRGDNPSAARMAMFLAQDSLEFRGEAAVCNGWMRRARRLLRGHEHDPAYGWLLVFEGNLALMLRNDTAFVLDSLATIKLVVFLEERFQVQIQAHETMVDYLDTVDQIAELVYSKM